MLLLHVRTKPVRPLLAVAPITVSGKELTGAHRIALSNPPELPLTASRRSAGFFPIAGETLDDRIWFMVDDVKFPAASQVEGLGGYQHIRRMVLAVLIMVLFAALLFGQSTFPPDTPVHEFIEMFGVLLIFLGVVGRLWATLYIGGRKSSEVVTGGPYSITRNPLYVFSTVAAAGVGAQIGSFSGIILFAVLCAGSFHIVILREEKYLKEALGAPYQAYLAKVPRFFPRLSLYEEGDTGSFKPRLLLNTLLDGLVFLIALPAFELIDSAQQSGILPVLFTLP